MYKIKLNQIREILGMEVSLEKIILMDGTELTTEKIEVGYPVFDSENNLVGAGEHTMEDGTIFKTDELGLITEIMIVEDEAPETEAPVEVVVEAAAVEVAPAHDPMQLVYETLSELGSEIASLKESVKMFSKAPAAAPIKKTEVEEISTFSKIDKLKQIKNQLKK
jgi:hypothetical protein